MVLGFVFDAQICQKLERLAIREYKGLAINLDLGGAKQVNPYLIINSFHPNNLAIMVIVVGRLTHFHTSSFRRLEPLGLHQIGICHRPDSDQIGAVTARG